MKRITQLFFIALLGVASTAHAGTKEELIRLQADVLALKNQISLLEKTFAERTDSIRSLVIQLNDQVGKSSLALGRISSTMETEASGGSSTQQALLQEVRSLSSKMDDTNTKIAVLAQQIADLKVQSQPIAQRLYPTTSDNAYDPDLSADQIFREAYNDLIQGKIDLAIGGFSAFLRDFPTNEKADDAQYYIGEAYYSSRKYMESIAAFDRVLTNYASGDRIANALYKRGKAKLQLGQNDGAAADFKVLVQDFPLAPEANQARAELQKLGIDPSSLAKSPVKRKKRP